MVLLHRGRLRTKSAAALAIARRLRFPWPLLSVFWVVPYPLRDLVSVYYLAEKYDAALRLMDRLAQRETPNAFFWFIRATCYDKLLLKAEAVAAYEKFLALDEGRSHNQGIQARARVRILKRELQEKK